MKAQTLSFAMRKLRLGLKYLIKAKQLVNSKNRIKAHTSVSDYFRRQFCVFKPMFFRIPDFREWVGVV